MMPPIMAHGIDLDRNQARELVGKIARSHGYISAETLERIQPQERAQVMEALRNKDDIIAPLVFK
jgi:hypothetical protein